MKNVILKEKFLAKYPDFPAHMNAIGQFVYLRTYSRYLPAEGRRETWKETCKRSVEYNVDLSRKHIEKMDLPITYKELEKEAEEWFDSMFNLQQFLSGRTLWVGGAENSVADKFPLANFNCFTRETEFMTDKGIKKFEDFKDGNSVNVLTSTGGWKEATVREFGHSEITELVVRKGKQVETIRTTDNHRWYVRRSKNEAKYIVKTTGTLKAGDVLRSKKRPSESSLQWKVVEVRKTNTHESVWCVQEPVTESFTLANGILTKNCSFTTIEKWEDLADHFYLLLVGGVFHLCRL